MILIIDQDPDENGDLRKLLELHWKHCQHLENERSEFMRIYAVIIGGISAIVLGFSPVKNFSQEFILTLCFLIILTVFGLFHTIRWIHAFEHHRVRVNSIIEKLDNKYDYLPIDLTMDIYPMRLWIFREAFRTRYWYPLFYLSVLVILLISLLYSFRWEIEVIVTAVIVLLFAASLIFGFILSLKDIKNELIKMKKNKVRRNEKDEKNNP